MNLTNIKTTLNTMGEDVSPAVLNKVIEQLSGKEMENEITKRQQRIDEINTIKIQAETKIAGYRESYSEIKKELSALGIEPKNTNAELLKLCKEIIDITTEIDNTMPDIESIKKMLQSNSTDTIAF